MIEFQGHIDAVIFENSKNFFKILSVSIETKIPDWQLETITVTGNFGQIELDESYVFTGSLVQHERFGQQFKADEYHQIMPNEKKGLVKYLSGENFEGIGAKTANLIVDELGVDTIEKIKKDSTVVDSLHISQKQKATLIREISAMDSFSDSLLSLTKLGLTKKLATQIYQNLRGDAVEKFKQNPYHFISKLQGFGFKTADTIGHNLGFEFNSGQRVQGAILQVLQDALSADGNTYLTNKDLLEEALRLLNSGFSDELGYDNIALELNHLAQEQTVIIEEDRTFLTPIYQTEWDIAQKIEMIQGKYENEEQYNSAEIETVLNKVQKVLKITYDDTQKSAIRRALKSPMFILTGGPGTGKTTIIAGIILAFRYLENVPEQELFGTNPPFLLAAPTGRAAKRMTEATGIEAKTIHRLLGLGHENTFLADELNELNGKLLIVDEMSMVDMFLFKLLIDSVNETPHIIFVGDKDQLPSVGAGNVFADLIKSHKIETVELAHVHRQGTDSSIIDLAHAVNQGSITGVFDKTINSSFIACRPDQIELVVPQIVEKAIGKKFVKDDVQVLGSMYRSESGIDHLNTVLQEQLNPAISTAQKMVEFQGTKYRIGDRVLQLTNNPEKDIYNGQIGKIISINYHDSNKYVVVDFDGIEVNLSKLDLSDLTLAYAITIHKAQGSEFPLVILTLTMQNYRMLRRNLLYTAITRARDSLVMVGERRAFETAITTPGNDRTTALIDRLNAVFKQEKTADISAATTRDKEEKRVEITSAETSNYVLTSRMIIENEIDPMIGMTGVQLG